jgi:protein translocase SecG subunit
MSTILGIVQAVVAILLIFSILVQERGAGLSEALAGSGASSFQSTKRGAEKLVARVTVGLFVLFIVLSLVLNFI